MAQINANYWAKGDSQGNKFPQWNYLQILHHYYTDVQIVDQYGREITPPYRWNPLSYTWANTGSSYPPAMNYGGTDTYQISITIQNSGEYRWRHPTDGGNLHWYLAYRWRKGSNVQQDSQSQWVEITQSGQPLTVSEGEHRQVTLTVHDPPDWGNGDYTLELDMFYKSDSPTSNTTWFSTGQAEDWFAHNITIPASICIQSGCQGAGDIHLPVIFKNAGGEPPPTGCEWQTQILENGNFGANLTDWTVTLDQNHGNFYNENLWNSSAYYPGDGSPAAYLGGQNDVDNNREFIDQAISQKVLINADQVEAMRIQFAYCLVTKEPSSDGVQDRFFVDLQEGILGSDSVWPNTIKYSNLNASATCDPPIGGPNWNVRERLVNKVSQRYQGNRYFTLAFYSDVNKTEETTFYFDVARIDICKKN